MNYKIGDIVYYIDPKNVVRKVKIKSVFNGSYSAQYVDSEGRSLVKENELCRTLEEAEKKADEIKADKSKSMVMFKCAKCGYEYSGDDFPLNCPKCNADDSNFIVKKASARVKEANKIKIPDTLYYTICLAWPVSFLSIICYFFFSIFSDSYSVAVGIWVFSSLGIFIASFIMVYACTCDDSINKENEVNARIKKYYNKVESFKNNLPKYKETFSKKYYDYLSQCGLNSSAVVLYDMQYWVYNGILYSSRTLDAYIEDLSKTYGPYFTLIAEGKEPYINDIPVKKLEIDNIKYFKKEGDIRYQTKVSGGGGGGSNLKGAVVGGVIAGETGAVIGSRNKVEPVKSEVVEYDERATVLKYFESGKLLTETYESFDMYNVFEALIPEKEYNIVTLKEAQKLNTDPQTTIIEDRLRKVKDLYEKNLISEDEYNAKKAEIINNI